MKIVGKQNNKEVKLLIARFSSSKVRKRLKNSLMRSVMV